MPTSYAKTKTLGGCDTCKGQKQISGTKTKTVTKKEEKKKDKKK